MMESQIENYKEELRPEDKKILEIDWNSLVHELGLLDVKILKIFYVPESTCWALDNVVDMVKNRGLKVSKWSVRSSILKLDHVGLLIVIKKTKPLLIQANHKIEENVKKLIILCSTRLTQ
jgi:hypothetical protein